MIQSLWESIWHHLVKLKRLILYNSFFLSSMKFSCRELYAGSHMQEFSEQYCFVRAKLGNNLNVHPKKKKGMNKML
jgi:hypothetical protein